MFASTAPSDTIPDCVLLGGTTPDISDTFKLLSKAAKQKLVNFLKNRHAWAKAPIPGSPPPVRPTLSPKATMPGCEFCPSLGGGCIVCGPMD
jgi:hypothetical protein